MLVLSRRINEKILFPTIQATIQIVSVKPGVVRLGIEAPGSVPVFREEVYDRRPVDAVAPTPAAENLLRELKHQVNNRLNSSTIGLALLRRQIEAGRTRETKATLDVIDQELQALRQRLDDFSEAQTSAAPKRRALVVEDDRNESELLAGFLRMAGMEVDVAGDGAAALDHLHKGFRPDVVLADMLMPRCDGPTLVRALRGDPSYVGLKIFGVTGSSFDRFGLDEGPTGIDRWFRKPLNPEHLLRDLKADLRPAAEPGDALKTTAV